MTNAQHGPRVGAGARSAATSRRSPSTSSPSRRTPRRWPTFGIDTENMFGFWDWVGGRYSMDSAVGLSTMIAIGPDGVPRHARRLPRDGRALPHRAVRAQPAGAARPAGRLVRRLLRRGDASPCCPTTSTSKRFPAYLQQLTMESNGKSVTLAGDARRLRDGPDLLGRAGHQRAALVLPADPPGHAADPVRLHRLRADAQPGRRAPRPADGERVRADRGARVRQDRRARCARRARADWLVPHRVFEGNRPTNTLLAERLTPAMLGKLVALYEHSVFTQGVDLEHQLVRPVGRGARQGARHADRRGAARGRPGARARLLDERADRALPRRGRPRRMSRAQSLGTAARLRERDVTGR